MNPEEILELLGSDNVRKLENYGDRWGLLLDDGAEVVR